MSNTKKKYYIYIKQVEVLFIKIKIIQMILYGYDFLVKEGIKLILDILDLKTKYSLFSNLKLRY